MIYDCVFCGNVEKTDKNLGNFIKCPKCGKNTIPYFDMCMEGYEEYKRKKALKKEK